MAKNVFWSKKKFVKLIYLIFTSFLAWTFLNFLAYCVVEKVTEKEDDDDEVVVAETPKEPSEDEKARDLRLMHLRKGFRLSSMCWDD